MSWKDASRDLDKWAGDDQEMIGLCSKVSTAVDVLLATPAPNIAGVLAKLDSMWKGGGEWSKDQTHRGQIVVDLESFTVRFSDMRPPVVY